MLREKLTAMCRAVGRPDQGARFRDIVVELARAFSGDQIKTNEEVRAILSDISDVPGAKRSLLAQSPQVLLQRANSSDPGVVDQLRKDVCWMAYHLENVGAGLYAQSGKLVWGGTSFTLAAGQEVTQRTYAYTPIVGAPIVYLPSEFFVLPENQNDEQPTTCEFFCN